MPPNKALIDTRINFFSPPRDSISVRTCVELRRQTRYREKKQPLRHARACCGADIFSAVISRLMNFWDNNRATLINLFLFTLEQASVLNSDYVIALAFSLLLDCDQKHLKIVSLSYVEHNDLCFGGIAQSYSSHHRRRQAMKMNN